MATHNRTPEATRALQAVAQAFDNGPSTLIGTYVLVDEAGDLRKATEHELARLPNPPEVLPDGDGDLYWSRSFAALLERALCSGPDFILHVNTDVTLDLPIETLLAPMYSDPRTGAVAGSLRGKTPLTGYRRPRAWFPFFRSVAPGSPAYLLPASCLLLRASALSHPSVSIGDLARYRHGFADIDLSVQLRHAGYNLSTTEQFIGHVDHKRYFKRAHHFERFDGSLRRYIMHSPTAPCWSDLHRIGRRLYGRAWFMLLRVYVPVVHAYMRFRIGKLNSRKLRPTEHLES